MWFQIQLFSKPRLIPCSRITAGLAIPRQELHKPAFVCTRSVYSKSKRETLGDRAAEFPDVIKEWHPSKNTFRPQDVSPFSNRRCWFICDKGHEWDAILFARTRQKCGCPTCNHIKAASINNVLVEAPSVAAEWHPTKNGVLSPADVLPGSRRRVWWQCKQGHEWEAMIANRVLGNTGCRKCAMDRHKGMRKGLKAQTFLAAHPDLAAEWHPTKNGVLRPDDVPRATQKSVWWQCSKDPTHEWQARIASRTVTQSGCPLCWVGGRRVNDMNRLLALHPEIAQEWHPTLNRDLTADKVTAQSRKEVWWLCKDCGHEWQKEIQSRTRGAAKCPNCVAQRKKKL
eukprot:Colp12_sorted_trinity150504_noHs@13036